MFVLPQYLKPYATVTNSSLLIRNEINEPVLLNTSKYRSISGRKVYKKLNR